MDITKAVELLREQIDRIDSLKHPPGYNPDYKIWKNTTQKIIKEAFDESYLTLFNRSSTPQMAMNDAHYYQLFLEDLEAKKQLLEGFIKEHERFVEDRAVDISRFTDLQTYDFHPKIKEVSQNLLENKHYAQAVEESFKRVIKEVKEIVQDKTGEALDGDKVMNRAFGFENQEPVVKFNSLQTQEEKDEQRGIMFLFKGIVGIRNRKAHDNVLLDDPKRAIEYLALASLLIRLLERFAGK